MRKKYSLGEGNWYINIDMGYQKILIKRSTKDAAARIYHHYLSVGKSAEWLGKWNGKDFTGDAPKLSSVK